MVVALAGRLRNLAAGHGERGDGVQRNNLVHVAAMVTIMRMAGLTGVSIVKQMDRRG